MKRQRNEKPLKRVNPSGDVVWVARWTNRHGDKRSAGTRALKREAQQLIWDAYEQDASEVSPGAKTVEDYFGIWLERHPRNKRNADSLDVKIRAVLDIKLDPEKAFAKKFRDWLMEDVSRRHAFQILDHVLVKQGRSQKGAQAILGTIGAMWNNAIDDEIVKFNPFTRTIVRRNDPRIRKAGRRAQVWTWEQMHAFAAACGPGPAEASVRVLSDCGLRLGEMLPICREDVQGDMLRVNKTAYARTITPGTKHDHQFVTGAESLLLGRMVPLPPATARLLNALPPRLGSNLLWPEETRNRIQHQRSWYRYVWEVGRENMPEMATATPHDFRHSWVSHLRAAGVDMADLALVSGHTVETATRHYTHSTGQSLDAIRRAVG